MAQCQNCSTPLSGPYCAQCGQKHNPKIPSVLGFLGEFTEAFTHADSRLWRTLGLLLVRPGELPKHYFAGQRAQFLPPLRLYLLATIGFFLLLSIDARISDSEVDTPLIEVKTEQASDEGGAEQTQPCDVQYSGPAQDYLLPKIKRACEQALNDNGASLSQRFVANVPKGMFVLMPLFAATMMLWYWRPRRYFMEHLILQVSNHSAMFLVGSIVVSLEWILPAGLHGPLELAVLPYGLFYCVTSLRVYYEQSRVLSWFKFGFLMLVYSLLLILVLVTTGIASII
ncbi:MAG: DUF3667 domain-containing protein [Halieaceae bacterium]|nr:DUF3667 domain-containing protein [Halieaceae bacterium]